MPQEGTTPQFLDELESDTRNVILTLARIWLTLATGEIRRKDEAAAWAVRQLPAELGAVLARARELYLAGRYGPWVPPSRQSAGPRTTSQPRSSDCTSLKPPRGRRGGQ